LSTLVSSSVRTPATSSVKSLAAALLIAAAFLPAVPAAVPAQSKNDPAIPPFYHTYAGLFYPSHADFKEQFGVSSYLIWGTGFGLPLSEDFLYLVIDLSWFQANAYQPGPPAANVELSQAFWHLGLLNKYFIAKTVGFRFQAGLNYNSAEMKYMPVGGPETRSELKRKLGFFGGAGIENQLYGGKMALFVDFVYDYRRSTEPEVYGDFGGSRIVAGLAAFLF
jgi:hypothetical protein